MKRTLSIGTAALIFALSSGAVISKSFPAKHEAHPQIQTQVSTTHLAETDVLGDIGDEFMSECNGTGNGKHSTCEQLWTGLGKIAASSPDGVQ